MDYCRAACATLASLENSLITEIWLAVPDVQCNIRFSVLRMDSV